MGYCRLGPERFPSQGREHTTCAHVESLNQLWQTDFTYFKVTGWGWFYLSTILDDFSRYVIAWKLCTTMKASDVTETLDMALMASGLDHANVMHRPRLLSDNGSSYIAGELAEWLGDRGIKHVRGAAEGQSRWLFHTTYEDQVGQLQSPRTTHPS